MGQSQVEAADLQHELSKGVGGRRLTLSVNSFAKTIQGRELIESQEAFCLGGKIYQGFNREVITVDPIQLTKEEMEGIAENRDIDGSMGDIYAALKRREAGRRQQKAAELKKRELASKQVDSANAMVNIADILVAAQKTNADTKGK